jgi:hypothetical protein
MLYSPRRGTFPHTGPDQGLVLEGNGELAHRRVDRYTLGGMFRTVILVITVATVAVGVTATASRGTAALDARCDASVVHFNHYPGSGSGFGQTPWVKASPSVQGLVGLLWYWTDEWRAKHITTAEMYAGGKSPATGINMKILWVFLAPKARTTTDAQLLIVKGTRLDGPGQTWQRFHPISYTGQYRAPSFASDILLPTAGCWRLELTAGSLHGTTTFRALSPSP